MRETEPDFDKYFDDIEGHIQTLEQERNTSPDSSHRDALHDRIVYLQDRMSAGAGWVDNDITRSPDAWKTLETYTEAEARTQYKIWDE